MIDLNLHYNLSYKWYSFDNIFVKGCAFDENECILTNEKLASYFLGTLSIADFKSRLLNLNGIFAIIILKENSIWAAVDRLRTFPLLFNKNGDSFLLSDNYRYFLSKIPLSLENNSILSTRSFGYVMGENTLFKNVYQLQAGSLLSYENNVLKIERWHTFQKKEYPYLSRNEWKDGLKMQLEVLGKRLIRIIDNRPVALPLSGGFDSRLIGLLLKINGYKNVCCFTYGNENYWEVKHSKEISSRLGFPWIFIDYKQFLSEDIFHNSQFLDYADYAGNAISFPYLVEYFSARYLKEQQKISENTLFLPGHSGDMVAGSHLLSGMEYFKSKKDTAIKILRKNGKQIYGGKKTRKFNISLIEENIMPGEFNYSHSTHDNWNITQRQSKQIVNSAKVWDFFGFEYYLPLWDNDFADFCLSMPFEFRVNKNLYEETLFDLFKEHDLLLSTEAPLTNCEVKKLLLKYQIKELFPALENIKRNHNEKQGNDFFYYYLFLSFIKGEFRSVNFRDGNGIMSEWYIRHVIRQLINEQK